MDSSAMDTTRDTNTLFKFLFPTKTIVNSGNSFGWFNFQWKTKNSLELLQKNFI